MCKDVHVQFALPLKQRSRKKEKSKDPLCSFVVSVDGVLAPEAVNTLQHIAQLLSEKW